MDIHEAIARARELVRQRNEIDSELAQIKQLAEILNAAKPKRTRKKKEPPK